MPGGQLSPPLSEECKPRLSLYMRAFFFISCFSIGTVHNYYSDVHVLDRRMPATDTTYTIPKVGM